MRSSWCVWPPSPRAVSVHTPRAAVSVQGLPLCPVLCHQRSLPVSRPPERLLQGLRLLAVSLPVLRVRWDGIYGPFQPKPSWGPVAEAPAQCQARAGWDGSCSLQDPKSLQAGGAQGLPSPPPGLLAQKPST